MPFFPRLTPKNRHSACCDVRSVLWVDPILSLAGTFILEYVYDGGSPLTELVALLCSFQPVPPIERGIVGRIFGTECVRTVSSTRGYLLRLRADVQQRRSLPDARPTKQHT